MEARVERVETGSIFSLLLGKRGDPEASTSRRTT
jgi:hypothetical protein